MRSHRPADALMDSIPIVCISGQVPTHLIGNDAFQEADTTGITRPCTKHNYLCKDVERSCPASSTRPFTSPNRAAPARCSIDIPKDVQFNTGAITAPKPANVAISRRMQGDRQLIERRLT
jgi:acetolactate synthase-1/2/3 large subunit